MAKHCEKTLQYQGIGLVSSNIWEVKSNVSIYGVMHIKSVKFINGEAEWLQTELLVTQRKVYLK